jgi:hypothetical protein
LLTDCEQELVSQLFLLYCGRPADSAGLEYWCAQISLAAQSSSGGNRQSCQDGSELPPGVILFDAHTPVAGVDNKQDSLALVDAFFRHALGRAATVRERAYIFAQSRRRGFTAIQLAFYFVNQLAGPDLSRYQMRLARARQFTHEITTSGRPYKNENIEEAKVFLREKG